MILQELSAYYERLAQDPKELDVPPYGFCRQGIHFCLVLNQDGELVGSPIDLRDGNQEQQLEVPMAVKKTSNILSNFLWDNTGYVLGADAKGKPKRSAKTFAAFKQLHHEIGGNVNDAGMQAVLRFLDAWDPKQAATLPLWSEMVGLNLVFSLDGDHRFIHQREAVRKAWLKHFTNSEDKPTGYCLVTGQEAPVSILHASIKGVQDAQTSGASMVSFNAQAFESYGKKQGANAPVSEAAAFGYTTALNHMLRKGSTQKVQIGDATTVFWTERSSRVAEAMADILTWGFTDLEAEPSEKEQERLPPHSAALLKDLRHFFAAVRKGRQPHPLEDGGNPFFILGLSQNKSRLAIRFWHVSTVQTFAENIVHHFSDLKLTKERDTDYDCPTPRSLLEALSPRSKVKNLPPLMGGQLMHALFSGQPYPRALVVQAISRIRAEYELPYLRVAIIKAYYSRALRRGYHFKDITTEEATVSLNPESTNVAYCLGRLFAVFEKVQRDALPGINTTIRKRYYGAASATPHAVFPQLIKLAQHHIAKSEYGHSSDRLIADIMDKLDDKALPAHLDLDGQAMFALGYYHQRNARYLKKDNPAKSAV